MSTTNYLITLLLMCLAWFMPQYRNKYWDGKISLFSNHTGEIYVGLLDKLIQFCEDHNIHTNLKTTNITDYHSKRMRISQRGCQGLYDIYM